MEAVRLLAEAINAYMLERGTLIECNAPNFALVSCSAHLPSNSKLFIMLDYSIVFERNGSGKYYIVII